MSVGYSRRTSVKSSRSASTRAAISSWSSASTPSFSRPGIVAEVEGAVVEHLVQLDPQGLALRALGDDHAVALLDRARRAHPVQRLVGLGVGVDRDRAVGLQHEQPGRLRRAGLRGGPRRSPSTGRRSRARARCSTSREPGARPAYVQARRIDEEGADHEDAMGNDRDDRRAARDQRRGRCGRRERRPRRRGRPRSTVARAAVRRTRRWRRSRPTRGRRAAAPTTRRRGGGPVDDGGRRPAAAPSRRRRSRWAPDAGAARAGREDRDRSSWRSDGARARRPCAT